LYAQKIEKMKLKIKNLKNDQIKNEKNYKKTYLVCWLFLVACSSKKYCKAKRGEGILGEIEAKSSNKGLKVL
jgi:hypothetical protein